MHIRSNLDTYAGRQRDAPAPAYCAEVMTIQQRMRP